MDYVAPLKELIISPNTFFSRVSGDMKGAIVYWSVILGLNIVVWFIVFGTLQVLAGANPLPLLMNFVGIYLFAMIMTFVMTSILFIWLKLWGGTASFSETYEMNAYANTPSVFASIPFLGQIFAIWSLVLVIFGVIQVHKMSALKASLLVLVLAGTMSISGILLFFIVIMYAISA